MNIKLFILTTVLFLFTMNSHAANVDEWVYKVVVGNLKSNPGCLSKEKAMKKAIKPYRFKKYTSLLCNEIGYGWSRDEVLDKGQLDCQECGGEYEGFYRCNAQNVKVRCKQVKRSW
ncbi:MAG: hypothetical protein KAG10_11050 [Methylococcales bacterium]|nr:hypothetical protein [Methylococcales bacterium]MCK5926424.1 hypothetical protein [Methylococcales bacterium]